MTWRPRCSLRTLAIFTLLCTSGFGLWWHWEAWYFDGALFERGWIEKGTSRSPDGTRVLKTVPDYPLPNIRHRETDAELWVFWGGFCDEGSFLDDDTVVLGGLSVSQFYRRRRPEWWWGVAWLPEFWLAVSFAGLFVWSVVRDRRALGKREATR